MLQPDLVKFQYIYFFLMAVMIILNFFMCIFVIKQSEINLITLFKVSTLLSTMQLTFYCAVT